MDTSVAARIESVLRGTEQVVSTPGDFAPSPFAPVVVPRTNAHLRQIGVTRVATGVPPSVLWVALGLVLCSALVAIAYILSRRLSNNNAHSDMDAVPVVGVPVSHIFASEGAASAPDVVDQTNSDVPVVDKQNAELAAEGEYTPLS